MFRSARVAASTGDVIMWAARASSVERAAGMRPLGRLGWANGVPSLGRQLRALPGSGVLARFSSLSRADRPAQLSGSSRGVGAARCAAGGFSKLVCRSGAQRPLSLTTSTAPAAETASTADSTSLLLYNTMSRKKEVFEPRPGQGKKVSMYVCGVTVYDYSHIGHARVYVAFDTLFRVLKRQGFDVTYCRNFTDIDDKIIKRANEVGAPCSDITERFIKEFHTDMESLGCLSPTFEPRATEHVPDIVALIEKIIANKHAYAVDGDVYFDVESLPGYGKLSGREQADNRSGERVAVDDRKRNPADFALWKGAKPNEPTWDSPWGAGRPGWHIECSAMIQALLGEGLDIHGGGADLVFPHHENELAQSQAACGCGAHDAAAAEAAAAAFVRYWVHNGFVKVDSEKMSKSLGNFFTIRDVLGRYAPAALRLMLHGTQYRAPINYTQRSLEEASDRAYYTYQTLADADAALKGASEAEIAAAIPPPLAAGPKGEPSMAAEAAAAAAELPLAVSAGLRDDLNTPQAVAALSGPLKLLNDLLSTKKGKKAPGRVPAMKSLSAAIRDGLDLLGLTDAGRPEEQLARLRAAALARAGVTEAEVAAAVEARKAARAGGDYAASDKVREDLAAKGIGLMDGGAQAWRPVVPAAMLQAE